MLTLASAALALPAILLTGALIGACGIGGVLLVPILTHLAGIPLPQAIAAASLSFALPALVALRPLRRQPELLQACRPLLGDALLGALVGALIVQWMSATTLMLGVMVLVLFAGWRGLRPVSVAATAAPLLGKQRLLILGFVVGLASALTGTGGPVLILPLLMLLRQPLPFAVIAAQAIQFPIALASSTVHAMAGRLDIKLALICGGLMLLGSFAGQRAAAGLNVAQLQRMVALLLLAVGLWFAWLLLRSL
ncbi:Sulfite exporter TauE/SafE [compost metagenome]